MGGTNPRLVIVAQTTNITTNEQIEIVRYVWRPMPLPIRHRLDRARLPYAALRDPLTLSSPRLTTVLETSALVIHGSPSRRSHQHTARSRGPP